MRSCIVVPIYNEEATIRHNIETILAYTKKLPLLTTVLLVNDGSKDATADILIELARQYGGNELRIVSHSENKGYGAAVKTGIDFAVKNNYDYAVFMDSDLTDHPQYLDMLYAKMLEGYDYIKTTRFAKGGGYRNVPVGRKFIAKYGNIFARLATGLPLSDITSGFRAVKVDILRQLDLTESHFSIIIEEIMKAKKITDNFCEVPRVQGTRSGKARAPKFTYDFKTYWKYIKYLFI